MNLESYVKALVNASDKTLTYELGIGDNWPFFVRLESEKIVTKIRKKKEYRKGKIRAGRVGHVHNYDFVPGTVTFNVFGWIPSLATTGAGLDPSKKADSTRQQTNYNATLMLHPYQLKRMQGASPEKAMAVVIRDISEFLIAEKIPTCIPRSRGEHYSERPVYWEP